MFCCHGLGLWFAGSAQGEGGQSRSSTLVFRPITGLERRERDGLSWELLLCDGRYYTHAILRPLLRLPSLRDFSFLRQPAAYAHGLIATRAVFQSRWEGCCHVKVGLAFPAISASAVSCVSSTSHHPI